MFMSRWLLQSLTVIAFYFAGTIHAEKEQFTSEALLKAFAVPELGEPVSNEELRRIDFTVLPDGSGLPVGSYWPYATTLFDYIRRAMPYTQPGKLTDDQTYALTAYVLFVNDVIPSTQVVDQTSLAAIVMPNRDGFVWSAEVKDLQIKSN